VVAAGAAWIVGAGRLQAQDQAQSAARGEALAGRECAMCHAVGAKGLSPNPRAPAFRDLHKRFALDDFEAGVLGDLLAGHPAMPQLRLRPAEVRDLLEYMRSLSAQRTARATPAPETLAGAQAGRSAHS
jgi:mono/diheme cytochrome c family protein